MLIWTELKCVPDIETAHVTEGYEDICFDCEEWGDKCETCDTSVPITCDLHFKKVKMAQMTICGIPVDTPYEIKEASEVKECL